MRDEHGVSETKEAVDRAGLIATSLISYAEVRSALARARAARRFRSQADYQRSVTSFDSDWPEFGRVEVSDALVLNAGRLAERHALKGLDALHLASVMALIGSVDDSVEFSTWDKRLATAATAEGLSLAHEVTT